MAGAGIEQVRHAGESADEYVHEHPWRTLLAAAIIAALATALISRRH